MMTESPKLNAPWMLAVWPGMGHVAMGAGYYLIARLKMTLLAELATREFFDPEQVDVRGGLIQPLQPPRSRLFLRPDPDEQHDLLVLLSEAQPPSGRWDFCRRVLDFARRLGVVRVITLAAVASDMEPNAEPRVFGIATDDAGLRDLELLGAAPLEDGRISGLNGLVLAAAAESGIQGIGLLGEIPRIFSQFPFPAASLAALRTLATLSNLEIDLSELQRQADNVQNQLGSLLLNLREQLSEDEAEELPTPTDPHPLPTQPRLTPDQKRAIEQLFKQARSDRSHAFELKNQLDQLGVFSAYEDRFLDLFRTT
jgi:predicted ATP-grasp superfamily ATP-dependent carboligase